MTALLEINDLTVDIRTRRGVIRAVDGVSLQVRPGEAVGLVGESGCGKTTTLRAILGLLPRTASVVRGSVRFGDDDITDPASRALRRARGRSISMIFQEPMTALNPLVRAGRQIAEALEVNLGYRREQADATAVDLMRRVGIGDPERRARAYPYELSGGMRQRVMIAMALACSPSVILCDEPTTALDVTVQDQILDILASLKREEELSIVYVSHDLAVVAQLCERVTVMYAGRVVETGTADEVFRAPQHPYTMGLMRSVPRFDSARTALVPIPGSPPDLLAPPPGCRFHPRCRYAADDCLTGEFPLLPLGEGRATACIHSARCVEEGNADAALPRGGGLGDAL